MSAWIVSKKHIDYMVTAAIAAELIPPSQADQVGRMLWQECLLSVAARYPYDKSGQRPGHLRQDSDIADYQWQETPVLGGGELAKTVGCYTYQSCEHPGWEASQAQQLCDELRAAAGTEEYEDQAPWGWDDWDERGHHGREIFKTREDGQSFVKCLCGWMAGWTAESGLSNLETHLQGHLAHFAGVGAAR